MKKASWSLLVFGIVLSLVVSCNDDEDDNGELPADFEFRSVFHCDGPLSADCEGEIPITEYTQVRIFYDWNENGPDVHDFSPIPAGYVATPEAWFANFADFYFNGSSFTSPALVFRNFGTGYTNSFNTFYLRAYTGDSGRTVWTSPMFSMHPHSGPPDTIDLTASEWTCELSDVDPPQCSFAPSLLDMYYVNQFDAPSCFETCAGSESVVYFSHCDTSNAGQMPIMKISGSCDDTPDGEVSFSPAAWQPTGFHESWVLPSIIGNRYGKITISWLDSVPCTNVDTLTVTRTDSNSVVEWNTTFEQNLLNFEIWLLEIRNRNFVPELLGDLPASVSSQGADYVFNAPSLQTEYSYQATIVAVADDGNKYPCKRVSVPAIES